MTANTIAISSDHAGVALKSALISALQAEGYRLVDCGAHDAAESVDYPDYAHEVCNEILNNSAAFGILICGSGIGMSIAANRHTAIRAALVSTPEIAALARAHNNANIICLGARFMDANTAIQTTRAFITTDFEGGRHARRVEKLG